MAGSTRETFRAVDPADYVLGFVWRSGELRKRGVQVPLQQQPFRILARLVEHSGEIVTREALRQELWPADTYVDFEQGINAAVKRLREALGDSAETPRFIETLPKRGCRFIAPVNALGPVTPQIGPNQPDEYKRWRTRFRSKKQLGFGLAATFGLITAALLWSTRGHRQGDAPRAVGEPTLVRLTANPGDMAVSSAHISPDGRHLAFADRMGLQVRSIDGGRVHRFADTEGMEVYGWTPDSAGVLASQCDDVSCVGWIIPLIGQDRNRTGTLWARHRYDRIPAQSATRDPLTQLPTALLCTSESLPLMDLILPRTVVIPRTTLVARPGTG